MRKNDFRSISDLLLENRESHKLAYMLVTASGTEDQLTYEGIHARALRIGSYLRELDMRGERVLLLYHSPLEFIPAFFGCMYAGAIAVPLQAPRSSRDLDRIERVLADTLARVVFCEPTIFSRLRTALPQGGASRQVLWTDEALLPVTWSTEWEQLTIEPNAVAYIQYTSGTTSEPKGVMVSHQNAIHNLEYIDRDFRHSCDSVAVTWLPHFHDMGLVYGILAPMRDAFPCYLMSPASFAQNPMLWLQTVSKYRGTHSGGPNSAYELCMRKFSAEAAHGLDLGNWQIAFNGSESVRRTTMETFATIFKQYGFHRESFYPAYGLAECTLKVCGRPIGHKDINYDLRQPSESLGQSSYNESSQQLVSCGGANSGMRVEIVDPIDFRLCPSGVIGELWISGPSVALGYWNRPDDTKLTFKACLADCASEFLRTGDLGFKLQDEIIVSGRLKEVMIIHGQNHWPQDIELTVKAAHPTCAQGRAVAFLSSEGVDARLFVLQELRRRLSAAEFGETSRAIRSAVAERHGLRVDKVIFVPVGTIVMTSSGKPRRIECRNQFLNGSLDILHCDSLNGASAYIGSTAHDGLGLQSVQPTDPRVQASRIVVECLASLLDVHSANIRMADTLVGLGLTSFGAAELATAIEKALHVNLDYAVLLDNCTVEQLVSLVIDRASVSNNRVAPHAGNHPELGALSIDEERLWLLEQLYIDSAALVLQASFTIEGDLAEDCFRASLNHTLERHPILRATYINNGQTIRRQIQDLQHLDSIFQVQDVRTKLSDHEIRQVLTQETRVRFNTEDGPLIRLKLVRMPEKRYLLILTAHHLVCDGWSLGLLVQDIGKYYNGLLHNPGYSLVQSRATFAEFVALQREQLHSPVVEAQAAYWQRLMAGLPTAPLRSPAPEHAKFDSGMPTELIRNLTDFSRKHQVTPFVVFLSAFLELIHMWSGAEDLAVAFPVNGRSSVRYGGVVGQFARPLPIRSTRRPNITFGQLITNVKEAVSQALRNQDVSPSSVSSVLWKSTGCDSPLRIMFSYFEASIDSLELFGTSSSLLDLKAGTGDFDLFATLYPTRKSIRVSISYNADIFSQNTIGQLVRDYEKVLELAMQAPDDRCASYSQPILSHAVSTRKILISATFTAEPIADTLRFWMKAFDIPNTITFTPDDQVFQQLLDPSSTLRNNQSGINVVLCRISDWLRRNGSPAKPSPKDALDVLQEFVGAVRVATKSAGNPYIVVICPEMDHEEQSKSLSDLVEVVRSELIDVNNIHLIGPDEVSDLYAISDVFDTVGDAVARIPYTADFFIGMATLIARNIVALQLAGRYKVIALDCDDVLWDGVCGEDGPEGITISERRRMLQQLMKGQQERGMILCLCSRNNYDDVAEVLRSNSAMVLKESDFALCQVNWGRKSDSLRRLSMDLGIGLDSFIFIDDSPVECEEVRSTLPQVLVVEIPSNAKEAYRFLRHVWAFDHTIKSSIGQKRNIFYHDNSLREDFRKEVSTLSEFINGLRLEVRFHEMHPRSPYIARSSELTFRTNQFNFRKCARSEQEIDKLLQSGEMEGLVVDLEDRFGSYGIVGVLLFESRPEALYVDTFLLSCRALARGVEYQMLSKLGQIAKQRKCLRIEIQYLATEKNTPVREFMANVGAIVVEEGGRFQLPPEAAVDAISRRMEPTSAPGRTSSRVADAGVTPPDSFEPMPLMVARIPQQFWTIEQIREATERPVLASNQNQTDSGPISETALVLSQIVSKLLPGQMIGMNDNFLEVGGHSLLAMQLASRVYEQFGVPLPIQLLFRGDATLATIADYIDSHLAKDLPPDRRSDNRTFQA